MVLGGPVVAPVVQYEVAAYTPRLRVFCSSQGSQKPEVPPRRITSNVKQNLMYLKLLKEHNKKRSSASSPKPATSYRKKKADKIPDDIRSYDDPTLKLYHTNEGFDLPTPVLLIDGYNLCGFWPKLKKYFSKGHLDTARQKLVHEMISFSAIRGVKVVVVFDAVLSGLTTRKETMQNVDVVYTVDSCADSWIEREVTLLRDDGCPRVWVVSSDTLHQHAAYGAGAYIWSCKVLISEVKEAKLELQELMQEENMYSVKGKLLEHNLSPEVLDALVNLKQDLKSNPG